MQCFLTILKLIHFQLDNVFFYKIGFFFRRLTHFFLDIFCSFLYTDDQKFILVWKRPFKSALMI